MRQCSPGLVSNHSLLFIISEFRSVAVDHLHVLPSDRKVEKPTFRDILCRTLSRDNANEPAIVASAAPADSERQAMIFVGFDNLNAGCHPSYGEERADTAKIKGRSTAAERYRQNETAHKPNDL